MPSHTIDDLFNQISELRKELSEIKSHSSSLFLLSIFNGDDEGNFFFSPSLFDDYKRIEGYKLEKNRKMLDEIKSADDFIEQKHRNAIVIASCAQLAFKKVQEEVDKIRVIFFKVLSAQISIDEARVLAADIDRSIYYNKYKHLMWELEDESIDLNDLDDELKKQYDQNLKKLKDRFNKSSKI